MEQTIFIVWRESVEALLVVGILYQWLAASAHGRKGLPWLWAGVVVGLILSLLLALALLGVSRWLTDTGQIWFQALMALFASALILQMVVWMHHQGRSLKQRLQADVDAQIVREHWWGVLLLVMLAVAREGSETVVFLYGTWLSARSAHGMQSFILAIMAGFGAAALTYGVLQMSGRLLNWKRFFQITQALLLLLAGALLVSASDRLIALDVLPVWIDPVWNSAWLLDTSSTAGRLLADFAGYRAYPALSQLVLWLGYWIVVAWLLHPTASSRAQTAG